MANNPFRNSPERPASEDLQGKASWDPEGSSQAHKALRDKAKEIDKRDCVIMYDAALSALQKEIHESEQAIQSKEKKNQEKQLTVYLEASNRIRSAVQGNIHEVRKNIET